MTKIKLNLKDILLDVDLTEEEKGSKVLTVSIVNKIKESLLEELNKDSKFKDKIDKVTFVKEGSLEEVNVGDVVKNPNVSNENLRYGVVLKINRKTIDVVFRNGVLRGPKEAFAASDKSYKEIRWEDNLDYVGVKGQFGTLSYDNKDYDSIIVNETKAKTHFYLFELGKVLTTSNGNVERVFKLYKSK